MVIDERTGIDELLREHRPVPSRMILRIVLAPLEAQRLPPHQHDVAPARCLRNPRLDDDERAERRFRQRGIGA